MENPTEDSVEIACDFMIECGKVMSDLSPAGVNAVFERFKGSIYKYKEFYMKAKLIKEFNIVLKIYLE